MAGKLNVYDLGQGGVNTSKSPVHLDTTELTKGQNAILDTAGVEGGLLKRGGMPRLNSSAMNGIINGAINVPLAEETAKTQTLYVALEVTSGSNTWRTSTDGSAYSFVTTPSKCAQDDKRSNAGWNANPPTKGVATLDGKIYYATDNYIAHSNAGHGPPPLRVFDGTNDEPVATVPYNPSVGDTTNVKAIGDVIAANKRIYFTSFDGSGGPTRVFEVAPASGQITQIGAELDVTGHHTALFYFNNRLWLGSVNGSTNGTIYSIRPRLDATWGLEDTITGKEAGPFMAFQGLLYCGTRDTSTAPTTRVRSSLGVWSDSDTGGLSGSQTYTTGPLIVFNGNLYAFVFSTAGANNTVIVRQFDGTSWTTDENLTTTFPGGSGGILQFPGMAVVYKSNLYVVFSELGGSGSPGDPSGAVLKRTTGGTWTNEDDVSARGWLGVVTA